ncbi:hypothetical protein BDV93DRAFT_517031 [Ceratobasidium sp. AG-I]|nr:hypothetical protein BDV93DRAFT_517031 [Ceratobasidium sp. AG-I]
MSSWDQDPNGPGFISCNPINPSLFTVITMYLGVYLGSRAAKHTRMMLCFTLHQVKTWYTVESNLDPHYNYFILYMEILLSLQFIHGDTFASSIVFPGIHLHPANLPNNIRLSAHEAALIQACALAGNH